MDITKQFQFKCKKFSRFGQQTKCKSSNPWKCSENVNPILDFTRAEFIWFCKQDENCKVSEELRFYLGNSATYTIADRKVPHSITHDALPVTHRSDQVTPFRKCKVSLVWKVSLLQQFIFEECHQQKAAQKLILYSMQRSFTLTIRIY